MVPPVEFRFVLKAYSPATMPLERLARYLERLAVILGESQSVHFVRLEGGSTVPVIAVAWEAVPKVRKRANDVRNNEGPQEARAAKRAIERDLALDNAEGGELLDPNGARLLYFPGVRRVLQPEYGPFNQQGTLDGTPIVIGGERDPVPVHLQDRDRIHICRASRVLAKRLAPFLFTAPVRAVGVGRWFRASTGEWDMRYFTIHDFVELKRESLSDAISRLQRIDGKWKQSDDPLNTLHQIRHSES